MHRPCIKLKQIAERTSLFVGKHQATTTPMISKRAVNKAWTARKHAHTNISNACAMRLAEPGIGRSLNNTLDPVMGLELGAW